MGLCLPLLTDMQNTLLGTCLYSIDENIERMVVEEPATKVGLVTFGSDVYIAGDCSKPWVVIPEYDSGDWFAIEQTVANKCKDLLQKSIKDAKIELQGVLYNTDVTGMTALGPSTLASVLLAGQN